MSERHKETNGRQPGNPKLAVQRVLDIARLENLPEAERHNMPLRIPLGSDALAVMGTKCTSVLESLNNWENFAASTDYLDQPAVPSYYR